MARGITPIERAIAGQPVDRRRRYEQRMAALGFKRATVTIRPEHAAFFQRLAALSRVADDAKWLMVMGEVQEFLDVSVASD